MSSPITGIKKTIPPGIHMMVSSLTVGTRIEVLQIFRVFS